MAIWSDCSLGVVCRMRQVLWVIIIIIIIIVIYCFGCWLWERVGALLSIGCCLGVLDCVQGSPNTGKKGSELSGMQVLSKDVCLVKSGHVPLSELAWLDEALQETQWWSLGLGQVFVEWGLAQVVQHSSLVHLAHIWPYSWHLLQHMGSCTSLMTTTLALAMNMHSSRM